MRMLLSESFTPSDVRSPTRSIWPSDLPLLSVVREMNR